MTRGMDVKARIYTKTGDKGETSLVDGSRVSKGDGRLETYGTLDELNSCVGLLRTKLGGHDSEIQADLHLRMIQNNLFNIGSHFACADEKTQTRLPGLSTEALSTLEADLDLWEAELPPLKEFILPGGTEAAAIAHMARTICRRAEREAVRLLQAGGQVSEEHLTFLNRLSDWFFLLARRLNSIAGVRDVTWEKN